jgi:hypothetical protein
MPQIDMTTSLMMHIKACPFKILNNFFGVKTGNFGIPGLFMQ